MATATPATTKKAIEPPKDFTDVSRPDIDGWVKPDVDTVVYGRICGFFGFYQIVKDKDSLSGFTKKFREAVCLKVYGNDTRAFKKGDKTGFLLKEGQVIAMSMMHCIEPIREYVLHRGRAWIHFTRKEDIGGGQTVWKAEVKCDGQVATAVKASAASAEQVPQGEAGSGGSGDSDEPPF